MEATPQQEIYLWLFIRLRLICAVINIRQLQFWTSQRYLLGWGRGGRRGDRSGWGCGAAFHCSAHHILQGKPAQLAILPVLVK